jgi:hypothetical protein
LDVFDESAMTMRERKIRKSETIERNYSWVDGRRILSDDDLPKSGEKGGLQSFEQLGE